MATDIDTAIAALADPIRRHVVDLLVERPRRTNELAEAVGVSVPAVSRHLRLLRERGIVDRVDVEGDGRGRRYELNPAKLEVLASWLGGTHWADTLPSAHDDADLQVSLGRVGGFLDAFAERDVGYFERHLADDAELYFPGSPRRWDKASTIDSVATHAPYVDWTIHDTSVRLLGRGLTIVSIHVSVRTTERRSSTAIVQSMIFDDTTEPWCLRFLQQSSATDQPHSDPKGPDHDHRR